MLSSIEAVVIGTSAEVFYDDDTTPKDTTTAAGDTISYYDPGNSFFGFVWGDGSSTAKTVNYSVDDMGDEDDNNFTITSSGMTGDEGGNLVDMDRGFLTNTSTNGTNSTFTVGFDLQANEQIQLDSNLAYFFTLNQDDQVLNPVIQLSMVLTNIDTGEVLESELVQGTDVSVTDTMALSTLVVNSIAYSYELVISMELLVDGSESLGSGISNDLIQGGWQDLGSAPSLTITSTVIPEPMAYALLLGLSACAMVFRRRRRSN